jgi:hypothetical protein
MCLRQSSGSGITASAPPSLAIPLAVWTVLALRLAWPLARMRFHPEDPDVLAAARLPALKVPLYQALLCFPGW